MRTNKQVIAGKKAKKNNTDFELEVCKKEGYTHIEGSKDKADAWDDKKNKGISIKRMSGKSTCVLSTTGNKLLQLFTQPPFANNMDTNSYFALSSFIYALCNKTINLNEYQLKDDALSLFYTNCETILKRVFSGYKSEIRAHIIEIYDNENNLLTRVDIFKMIKDFLDNGKIVISPKGTVIWFVLNGDKILHLQRKGSGPTPAARRGLYFHIHKHPKMFNEWKVI